jgi:hypothetical protein
MLAVLHFVQYLLVTERCHKNFKNRLCKSHACLLLRMEDSQYQRKPGRVNAKEAGGGPGEGGWKNKVLVTITNMNTSVINVSSPFFCLLTGPTQYFAASESRLSSGTVRRLCIRLFRSIRV